VSSASPGKAAGEGRLPTTLPCGGSAEKGACLKAQGPGGVIQWELNEAYLSTAEGDS
jgi:hypothetical protein